MATIGERAMLRALMDLAPDFVTLIGRDGLIRYVSPAVERITGYRSLEMVGHPFDEFLHPADHPKARQAFHATQAKPDALTVHTRFRRKDGGWIDLESIARGYADEQDLEGALVSSRDITRSVKMNSTLQDITSFLASKFGAKLTTPEPAPPVAQGDPLQGLSARERQILALVTEGYSSKEVGAKLRISPKSVDTYRSRLMTKLNVENVTGLVRFAIRKGVIEP